MTNAVAPLITTPLAALAQKSEGSAVRMYRLRKCFAAVQFEEDGKGRIVFLPEGAELRVVGASSLCKCFEVSYKDRLYSIFQEDLLGVWSMPIRRTGRGNGASPSDEGLRLD
jgi:hypothetical protein